MDEPILLHVVREAVAAGIEDLVIIAGRGKSAIDDFFDRSYELEDTLLKAGKESLLKSLREVQNMVNVISVRQKEAKGLGHAVLMAKPVVGEEAFAVLLGDEVTLRTEAHHENVTEKLIQAYQAKQVSTVAVMEVAIDQVNKYGIVAVDGKSGDFLKVTNVVEKPEAKEAPSQWALPGRYVFTKRIFQELAQLSPGKNGEIQLTDAMTALARSEGLLATPFSALRFDTGDKLGFLMANVELALRHPEIGPSFREYLKNRKL